MSSEIYAFWVTLQVQNVGNQLCWQVSFDVMKQHLYIEIIIKYVFCLYYKYIFSCIDSLKIADIGVFVGSKSLIELVDAFDLTFVMKSGLLKSFIKKKEKLGNYFIRIHFAIIGVIYLHRTDVFLD